MKKVYLIIFMLSPFIMKADSWTQKANFGGTPRYGAAEFSIGSKGYIGIGSDAYPVYHFVNDFWEYDTITNSWSQKANFP